MVGEDTVGLAQGMTVLGLSLLSVKSAWVWAPGGPSLSLVQRPLTAQLLGVCGGGFFCQEVQNKGGRAGEKEEAELSAYPGA